MEQGNKDALRELYHVVLSFDSPMEGTIMVAARDEEHAKEIANDLFKDRKNVRIVDLYPVKDVPTYDNDNDASEDDFNFPTSKVN